MRLESKFKVSRLAKYAIIVYIMISLFYTTNHYFSIHHVQTSPRRQDTTQRVNALPPYQESSPNVDRMKQNYNQQAQKANTNQVIWPGSKGKNSDDPFYKQIKCLHSYLLFFFLGGADIHELSTDLIKSKIFSSSMGLDNVTPYYFKASHKMKDQDITLATLVTRNRFRVLSRLASNYKGKHFF